MNFNARRDLEAMVRTVDGVLEEPEDGEEGDTVLSLSLIHISRFQVYGSCGPCVQLLLGVILCVDRVDRIIK